jgi:hypothetical protein
MCFSPVESLDSSVTLVSGVTRQDLIPSRQVRRLDFIISRQVKRLSLQLVYQLGVVAY